MTPKRHNSSPNKNDSKAVHSFAPTPPIFKLKQEVLKFSDICVSWSYLKNILEAKF